MHSLAAVFEGNAGQIVMRNLPIHQPRGAEILVRVLGCTLCGSDLHSFEGRRKVPVPTVLGHETVGQIVALGQTAPSRDLAGQELRRGDRVTWAIVAHCGECAMCQRGLVQKCLYSVKYGHEPFRPGRELLGGLAEYCLLVRGTSIVRLPDDLPLAVACPASCATATVVAALEAVGDLAGRSVCLFGAGMLGLTACALARSGGAATVVCADPIPMRRQRAMLFGATHIASPEELAAVSRAAVGALGFDAVLELSGNPAAFNAAWPLIQTGGTLVLVGSVFPTAPTEIFLEQIVRRHLTLRGIHNYAPRHLLAAVEFLGKCHDATPFADLVAPWLPLKSVAAALTSSAQATAVRVGICPTVESVT